MVILGRGDQAQVGPVMVDRPACHLRWVRDRGQVGPGDPAVVVLISIHWWGLAMSPNLFAVDCWRYRSLGKISGTRSNSGAGCTRLESIAADRDSVSAVDFPRDRGGYAQALVVCGIPADGAGVRKTGCSVTATHESQGIRRTTPRIPAETSCDGILASSRGAKIEGEVWISVPAIRFHSKIRTD